MNFGAHLVHVSEISMVFELKKNECQNNISLPPRTFDNLNFDIVLIYFI